MPQSLAKIFLLVSVFLFPLTTWAQSDFLTTGAIAFGENKFISGFISGRSLDIIINVSILLAIGMYLLAIISIIKGWFLNLVASGNEDKIEIAKEHMCKGAIALAVMIVFSVFGHYFIGKTRPVTAENDLIFFTDIRDLPPGSL